MVVGGLAGGTTLAATATGCGTVEGDPGRSAGPDPVDPTAPAVDADSDLVDTVAGRVADTLSLTLATAKTFPALRPLARRLSDLHRAHLAELGRADDVPAGRVTGAAETARARLLRSERKLQERLVAAALAAESGALAQVLASMAAAIAQQREVAA